MINLTPRQKVDLMREYTTNPMGAIFSIAEILKGEMRQEMTREYEKIKKELPDLKKVLETVTGKDGEDAEPKEVASNLLGDPEFLKLTKGENGKDGHDGKNGANGKDGQNGANGKDGKRGEKGESIRGKDGKDGENGKDGSPDKPKDIAEKLNKTKNSVEKKVIIGLMEELTLLRRLISEKGRVSQSGGGMGNWVHQQFTVSSLTTSVTLTSRIAAKGYAVLVRYQGQLLAHGIQYSIGTDYKTITPLFTPENSTYLDVTYVRT